MAIFDLAEAAHDASARRASFCVVGGGMAGLVMARHLSRAGHSVIVLESGGRHFSEAVNYLNAIENVDGRYTGAMTSRYRGLGGTSNLWGGRTIPINSAELGERDYLGHSGWPFAVADLDRYNGEIEGLFGLDDSSYEVTEADEPFPADGADFNCRWAKWPRFASCNLGRTMSREIEASLRLSVWTNATVNQFHFDHANGKLTGLTARHVSGRSLTIEAGQFIIAAGAIETTRLLLWLQRQSNDRALTGHNALGYYFQDHLHLRAATICRQDADASNKLLSYRFRHGTRRSLHLEMASALQRRERVHSAFAYVAMDMTNSPLEKLKHIGRNLQKGRVDVRALVGFGQHLGLLQKSLYWRFRHRRVYVPPSVRLHLDICAEQMPVRSNRIELSANLDVFGVPVARLHWLPTEADERTFRKMVAGLELFWTRSGIDNVAPLQWNPVCLDPDRPIIDGVVDYYHPSGTTRMGRDPASCVVAPDLSCHGLPNVSVISASTFPNAGSANPTLTLLKLALRLGDRLLASRG